MPSGSCIIETSIVLIGAGGHARACIDVIERQGSYRIAGLVGRPVERDSMILGHRVIGTDDDLPALATTVQLALVTVGQLPSAALRVALWRLAVQAGFTLPAIVSPHAYVSPHARVGAGSIVMHRALLNVGVQVGENCIVNSSAQLEHDVVVESDCHVSTGVLLNGDVHVGRGSFIGSHSVVMEGLEIPPGSVLPMGSVVTRRNLAQVLARRTEARE